MRVSPFRNLRIDGYLLLPEAFRSLSRLSSALSAKASALRSFCVTSTFSSVRMFGLFLGSSLILDVSLVTYSRMSLDVSIFTCSFKFINSLRLDMFSCMQFSRYSLHPKEKSQTSVGSLLP